MAVETEGMRYGKIDKEGERDRYREIKTERNSECVIKYIDITEKDIQIQRDFELMQKRRR